MFELGRGLPQDDARAARYYRRACEGGVALACANLGQLQRMGRAPP